MPGSPYADLRRPPLPVAALRRALVVPGGLWTELRVVAETASTNADVAEAARTGAPEGLVLVAEHQSAGRGRLGRRWLAPPRAGITASVLLRPGQVVPTARFGWLPLLAAVALAEAVGRVAVVQTAVKWPNDLLVRSAAAGSESGYGKCAGVLVEVIAGQSETAGPGVVVGIGLNVSQAVDELPAPAGAGAPPATSLTLAGAAHADRDPLLRASVRALEQWYLRWRVAGGDPDACGLRDAYRRACRTIGQEVSVALPDGEVLRGWASDVDVAGRLEVRTAAGVRAVAAGDVRHVR